MHESLLIYKRFRYFKWSVFLMILSIGAYIWHNPVDGPNGGTWLGYTLGGIGAALILWLLWFGVRKRNYRKAGSPVEGWLSAHVYLGISLIVISTLHAGFNIGWNVHTLAYFLMLIVILSGFYGVFAYMRYPNLMTKNRHDQTMHAMMSAIADTDRECRDVASQLSDEVNKVILNSCQKTVIGGSMRRQLSGNYAKCPTAHACSFVEDYAKNVSGDNVEAARRLLALLNKKSVMVERARRDVQFKALMDIWLYLHVPLSIGLLAALIAHVISVFFYW
jgi:hypothetical protein